ncbi:MAG: DUF2892 domain-containing protein [candidate division Zixibacteria bacterium]|jgi:hypothetical protein|nr:DUF2892 domain-containing protein [candidate division Zixibacteria bacterium]
MKRNMANIERVIRVVVGLFVLSLIFWGPQTYWGLLGLIPLLTALSGWCPLYTILGTSTRKEKHKTEHPAHSESA